MAVSEGNIWWRRKRNGRRYGITTGTSLGKERKVFSTIRPWIRLALREARWMATAPPMLWPSGKGRSRV